METYDLKYIKMAQQLNSEYHEKLIEKELHFRGNINSFSLVSLSEKTPELGISNLKSLKQGEKALEDKIDTVLAKDLGRLTPEKALQAWIIKYAFKNNMSLPFGKNLSFVTSELAFNNVLVKSKGENGKLVNDLLAIDDEGNLWVIELKSAREKSRLSKQVDDFIYVVEEKRDLFLELIEILNNRIWNGSVMGMVVWPYAKTSPLDWGNLKEVCYHHSYSFTEF